MVRDSSVCRSVIYPCVFKRIQREKASAAEVECANLAFHRKITRTVVAVIIPCVYEPSILLKCFSKREDVAFSSFFFFSRPRKRGRGKRVKRRWPTCRIKWNIQGDIVILGHRKSLCFVNTKRREIKLCLEKTLERFVNERFVNGNYFDFYIFLLFYKGCWIKVFCRYETIKSDQNHFKINDLSNRTDNISSIMQQTSAKTCLKS